MRHPDNVYLDRSQLRHRGLYELAARKLVVGIWDAEKQGFLGLYGEYLEYEYLWTETDGTASGVRLIEMLLEGIELRSHDPASCALHERPVNFQKRNDGTPFGDWSHADDGTPLAKNDPALARTYMPMYEYLTARTYYPPD